MPKNIIAKGSSASPESKDLAAGNRQEQATPNRKRSRPRSAVEESPINARSPPKWISPRRCSNNGENCNGNGCSKLSEGNIACSFNPPRKRLADHFSGKPKWNPRDPAQLQAVKEALHIGSALKNIVCREEEQRRILEFCKACIREERAGSLYVCGCPGTGKTLSIDKVKELLLTWSKEVGLQSPDMLSINCTSLTKTSEIFSKVLENFQSRNKANGCLSPLQCLQNCFSQKRQLSSRKMMMIIIDEMDYLITKDRAVLHDLFMLTTFPFSKCILIGIANAIDLADRFLPKLESLNCKPMVVTFPAYSKDQILQILQQRLTVLGYDVFQSVALDFCARKVAAASGDMRRALDVCRIAIEVLQAELGDSTAKQEVDAVTFDHMDIALSKAFKSAVVDTIHSLPQHQQIILCSLVKLFFHCKKNATTLGELNREYSQICKSNQIPSVSMLEFTNMCRVLGDQGLLKLGQSREDKLRRVTLQVDTSDITFAFKESPKSAHVYLAWHQEDPTKELDMKVGLKFLVTHHKGRHNAPDK